MADSGTGCYLMLPPLDQSLSLHLHLLCSPRPCMADLRS